MRLLVLLFSITIIYNNYHYYYSIIYVYIYIVYNMQYAVLITHIRTLLLRH